jgi:hypothetical protein
MLELRSKLAPFRSMEVLIYRSKNGYSQEAQGEIDYTILGKIWPK